MTRAGKDSRGPGGFDLPERYAFLAAGREEMVELEPGRCCLVPRGTWHRQVVRTPGRYLGATFGKGTQHRPR